MSQVKKNEKSTFSRICSVLLDIFIIPIVIVAFIASFMMSNAKKNNEVPSFLGNAIVEVMSGSMVPQYKKGDVLLIDTDTDLDQIKVGDDIAFYAPKNSGWVIDGNSLVIFHRVGRIIKVKDSSGNEQRFFVCHGINESIMKGVEYIKTTNNEYSDYAYDQATDSYYVQPGGGYVLKLLNDTDKAPTTNQEVNIQQELQKSTLQYVTEDYVVGKYKSSPGWFISAFTKFCTSSIGIIILVIIPSMVMIAFVILELVNESKKMKKDKQSDQAVLENISNLKESSVQTLEVKDENKDENAPQQKLPEKPQEQQNIVVPIKKSVIKDKSLPLTKIKKETVKKTSIKKDKPLNLSKTTTITETKDLNLENNLKTKTNIKEKTPAKKTVKEKKEIKKVPAKKNIKNEKEKVDENNKGKSVEKVESASEIKKLPAKKPLQKKASAKKIPIKK